MDHLARDACRNVLEIDMVSEEPSAECVHDIAEIDNLRKHTHVVPSAVLQNKIARSHACAMT